MKPIFPLSDELTMEAATLTHQNCTQKEHLEDIENRLNDMSTRLEDRYSQSRRCAMQEKPTQQLIRAAEDFGISPGRKMRNSSGAIILQPLPLRDRVDIEGAEAAIENLWRSIDGECHGLDKTMPSFQDYTSAKAASIKAQVSKLPSVDDTRRG